MDEWYALEKLAEAAQVLKSQPGPPRARLYDAAPFLIRIQPREIRDPELRDLFIAIKSDITREEGPDGSLVATLKKLDEETATVICARILDLYQRLDRSLR